MKMKKYFIITILLFCNLSSYAQGQDLDFVSRLQGIKQNDILFFELEGYQIYVRPLAQPFNEKGIKKARRELKIAKSLMSYSSGSFSTNHQIINQTEVEHGNLKTHQSWYLFEKDQHQIICFWFASINKKDTVLEHRFINAFLNNQIPQSVYTSMQVDSINFAGRQIVVGNSCEWMGVRNLQCPYYGQMNWSLHRTLQDAENMNHHQFLITSQNKMGTILENKEVAVIFEGVETKAKRAVFKIKLPSLLIGGSNKLIIYYVTTKVRDHYISCVLSHYTNDITNEGLPPLLNKVMKLK